jgi:hypothetical protein
MAAARLQWMDQAGTARPLRQPGDLSAAERSQLDLLRRQVGYAIAVLDAGFDAPALSQAPPNMVRMMLRILLPSVAKHQIATFDTTEAHALLTLWWAIADTTS